MSAKKSSTSHAKRSPYAKLAEIRRCDHLRARIKTYCRQENIPQVEMAERLRVSKSQMANFMVGETLTGSIVYEAGMKYLKTRLPLSKCSSDDLEKTVNNKWKIVFREEEIKG